jgi:hypothetical protein
VLAAAARRLPAVAETTAPTTEGQPLKPVVFCNAQVFTTEYDYPYAEAGSATLRMTYFFVTASPNLNDTTAFATYFG